MLSGWPNKSRWLDEPMPSELLKAAVWGSIWRPQGGLGTLEQMHSPFRVPSRGVPPPRHQPHRGRPARQSSLYAAPIEQNSMLGHPRHDRLGSLDDHDPLNSLLARRSAGRLPKPVQQQRIRHNQGR